LAKRSGQKTPQAIGRPYAARVSLLIPTHALPPLSYKIPDRLRTKIRVGATVVAPLSGRHRLGIVIGLEGCDERAREDVLSVVPDLSLRPELVTLCLKISESAAVPLPSALRAALPPGIATGRYRILESLPGQPWDVGSTVTRGGITRTHIACPIYAAA
jgi:primosomal protein N' (replication factor Y)